MRASSVSVAFPAARVVEKRIDELRVTQEEYRHDIAVFDVPNVAPSKAYYRADSPVTVAWSAGRDMQTFNGYVHHVEPYSSGTQVWCRGASTSFDNGMNMAYYRRTFPSVVGEIARAMNFDVDVRQHGRVFDSMSSTGGRIWEMLVKYAQEIGYSLYAKNTRLLLHPRTELIDTMIGQAPVLWVGTATERGSLHDFRPVEGAAQPGSYRHDNVLTGVDRWTGVRFQVAAGQAAPRLGRKAYTSNGTRYHDLNVSSPEEARWIAQAMGENARFQITAKAVADGNPRVHQTWPVLVSGVDRPYMGAWWVQKVTHLVTPTAYTMELDLGRDGLDPTGEIPDPRAKRVVATRDNPQGKPRSAYPPSVLNGGQWRSQWSSAVRSF